VAKSRGESPLLKRLLEIYRTRLTARGQYLLWAVLIFGTLGLDTRRNQVYKLFAILAAVFLIALLFSFLPRPHVRLDCLIPTRLTAFTPVTLRARVTASGGLLERDLCFSLPPPYRAGGEVRFTPWRHFFAVQRDEPIELTAQLEATRRGRYLLRGPEVRCTDPLRLTMTRPCSLPEQLLLVYPRFYAMEDFMVPMGRRYQPGGIPLASSTGDAIEFVGTREYREGDPIKHIHWRSFARRGEPVVKEYQEEYFCRIAVIFDTFLPPRPTGGEERAFEAAISVTASIADFFSRGEYIVDILAAGPDIYEVSAGRSLAYLENILDVLACLEPCGETPFQTISPVLFEKLAQITTVVAVLLDWDGQREQFLQRVKSLGTAVRVLVVHEGETREPWQQVGEELGEISLMTPEDVERALQASAAGGAVANRPAA
jgi:uncharacterized protein (DUF58 family)